MAQEGINYEHRNEKTLEDFYAYCKKYPQLRFWQALTRWGGARYIFIATEQPILHNECLIWRIHEISDPYSWEYRKREPDEES